MASALRFGALDPGTVHLCVDMQTLFIERTDWHVPWLERVLPAVVRWPRCVASAPCLPASCRRNDRRTPRASGDAITRIGET